MNAYKKIWNENIKKYKMPSFYNGCTVINFSEFQKAIDEDDMLFSKKIIEDLISGNVILVKSAFSKDFVDNLKKNVKNFWKTNPDSFHKMTEGCPDFHRMITPEKAKNYSVGAVKHATYFFPWNSDPCKINEKIFNRWGYIKKLCGLKFDEFCNNTPKDNKVDRIQIAVYPPGFGELETHTDPVNTTPIAISGYLSSLNSGDFFSGGFYCVTQNGKKINLEDQIDIGDIGLFCATVKHGVTAINMEKLNGKNENNSDEGRGRWFMGLYTNDSDEKKNRTTSISYKDE
mgnify:CR=1 FL=1